MIAIERIYFSNVMSYKDSHLIDFKDRNSFVLFGKNCDGKTTLLNIIKYALFPKLLARGIDKPIWLINNESDELSISIYFEKNDDKYVLNYKLSRKELTINLFKNGEFLEEGINVYSHISISHEYATYILFADSFNMFIKQTPNSKKSIINSIFGLNEQREKCELVVQKIRTVESFNKVNLNIEKYKSNLKDIELKIKAVQFPQEMQKFVDTKKFALINKFYRIEENVDNYIRFCEIYPQYLDLKNNFEKNDPGNINPEFDKFIEKVIKVINNGLVKSSIDELRKEYEESAISLVKTRSSEIMAKLAEINKLNDKLIYYSTLQSFEFEKNENLIKSRNLLIKQISDLEKDSNNNNAIEKLDNLNKELELEKSVYDKLVSDSTTNLEKVWNKYLTEFNIVINIDKEFEIKFNGEKHLDLLSTFQKNIIDLAFRYAIIELNKKLDWLFSDESYDTMDLNNRKIYSLFIKSLPQKHMIVSHFEEHSIDSFNIFDFVQKSDYFEKNAILFECIPCAFKSNSYAKYIIHTNKKTHITKVNEL